MTLLDVSPADTQSITFPANITETIPSWWYGNKITLPATLFSGIVYSTILFLRTKHGYPN